ncbi:hypothetical protein BMETH_75_5 [methanotrophic bacterial endosymbiont of Bathymodiolus sp.]|nr:hypothetical protein BMETH_75_5 [methanotrophic bacterial endosymbiont of Bathymodiolus sp.]
MNTFSINNGPTPIINRAWNIIQNGLMPFLLPLARGSGY